MKKLLALLSILAIATLSGCSGNTTDTSQLVQKQVEQAAAVDTLTTQLQSLEDYVAVNSGAQDAMNAVLYSNIQELKSTVATVKADQKKLADDTAAAIASAADATAALEAAKATTDAMADTITALNNQVQTLLASFTALDNKIKSTVNASFYSDSMGVKTESLVSGQNYLYVSDVFGPKANAQATVYASGATINGSADPFTTSTDAFGAINYNLNVDMGSVGLVWAQLTDGAGKTITTDAHLVTGGGMVPAVILKQNPTVTAWSASANMSDYTITAAFAPGTTGTATFKLDGFGTLSAINVPIINNVATVIYNGNGGWSSNKAVITVTKD